MFNNTYVHPAFKAYKFTKYAIKCMRDGCCIQDRCICTMQKGEIAACCEKVLIANTYLEPERN